MVRRCAILFMWYSTVSPGRTGLRNFALSMVRKYTGLGCATSHCTRMRQSTPAGLRHALDHQHAGENRIAGKMPLELRLIDGHVLDADAGFITVESR